MTGTTASGATSETVSGTTASATMRAARWHRGGGDDGDDDTAITLRVEDVPVPEPGPGEVLVQVGACALNQVDLLQRRGEIPSPARFPFAGGSDIAGVVAGLGAGVETARPGDRVVVDPVLGCGRCASCAAGRYNVCRDGKVVGVQSPGGFADLVVVPAAQLVPLPDNVGLTQAAAAAIAGSTAWHMLHRRARIQPGESVLVVAGGSGVGVIAVQLALAAGCRVISTAGSPSKRERLAALGAAVVDHHLPDWHRQVRELTGGAGVDVVVDYVGTATWAPAVASLARSGRLVICGGHSGFEVRLNLWDLFGKELSLLGSFAATRDDLVAALAAVADGSVRVPVDRVVDLDGLSAALDALADRQVFGKVLVVPPAAATLDEVLPAVLDDAGGRA